MMTDEIFASRKVAEACMPNDYLKAKVSEYFDAAEKMAESSNLTSLSALSERATELIFAFFIYFDKQSTIKKGED